MTANIPVVQLASGMVVDLPGDTITFDTPHAFSAGALPLDRDALEFSRALSSRANGEEFLFEPRDAAAGRRLELVLATLDPTGAAR